MQPYTYKYKLLIGILLGTILLLLASIVLYNTYITVDIKAKQLKPVSIWPFILIVLGLGSIAFSILTLLKAISQSNFETLLNEGISRERSRILNEAQKEKESIDEEDVEDNEEDIIEKSKLLVPKGKFKNPENYSQKLLKCMADSLNLVQGIVYIKGIEKSEYTFCAGYALTNKEAIQDFKSGENLVGQVAETREISYISNLPEEYFNIESGLGEAKPGEIIIVPVVNNNETIAILELASFKAFDDTKKQVLEGAMQQISTKFSQTIKS